MKIKTSELTGAALDWAVWVAAGGAAAYPKTASGSAFLKLWKGNSAKYVHPSTDWAQGGPIIESIKGFLFKQWLECRPESCCQAEIHNLEGDWIMFGPTPLIAAMRCYVASKLGDEVDVPEELMP